jgi:hypothetical protein
VADVELEGVEGLLEAEFDGGLVHGLHALDPGRNQASVLALLIPELEVPDNVLGSNLAAVKRRNVLPLRVVVELEDECRSGCSIELARSGSG